MTLYEFNILSFEDKYKAVIEQGIFLDNYVTKTTRLNCYAIDKFFVEVVYNSESNTVTEVKSFKYGHELDKYSGKFNEL